MALTDEQRTFARNLGLTEDQVDRFGELPEFVVFQFRTEAEPGIAIIRVEQSKLRLGIVYIHDEGGGIKALLRLKQIARRLAVSLHLSELETFGAAIINNKLKALLLRKGFQVRIEACPAELGNEEMEIVSLTESID